MTISVPIVTCLHRVRRIHKVRVGVRVCVGVRVRRIHKALSFEAIARWFSCDLGCQSSHHKNQYPRLPDSENRMILWLLVLIQCHRATDGQTDGRTDIPPIAERYKTAKFV